MGNFHQHDQRVAPGALLETNRERTLCLARRASRDRVVASTSCSLPLPSLFSSSYSPSSPSSFQPHELCDCYRSTSDLRGFQHRYFHLNGVSLSYIELMGRHELHGTWWPASDNVSTCSAPSTMWARPAREKTWVHSRWAQGLAKLALALAPTVLVVNIGHHLFVSQGSVLGDYRRMSNVSTGSSDKRSTKTQGTSTTGSGYAGEGVLEFVVPRVSHIKPLATAEWEELREALRPLQSRTTILWKTTSNTGSRTVPSTEARVAEQFFDVFDAHRLSTQQLDPRVDYWDEIHLKSSANNLLNWALLTQLLGKEWAAKAECASNMSERAQTSYT